MNLTDVAEEVKAIFKQWPIWVMLGTQDIKLRYRRSTIGPFWITITMAVTICCMGFLYGHLFKVQLKHYFPYLTSGLISWTFISTFILESSNIFIESENYIKNQESFMSLFIARLILRNLIVFAHNVLVFIPIIFIFHVGVGLKTLLFLPGLLIIFINMFAWGSLLAIIGTRYRDFPQIISSLVQVIFFSTPILWMPQLLPPRLQWLVAYNPFEQFLSIIRIPLLNQPVGLHAFYITGLVTIIGVLLYIYFLNKYKSSIVFWL